LLCFTGERSEAVVRAVAADRAMSRPIGGCEERLLRPPQPAEGGGPLRLRSNSRSSLTIRASIWCSSWATTSSRGC